MSDLIFCINAVLPIFLVVFFGYFLGRRGLLDPVTAGKMNTLCFKWALPVLLFCDLVDADFGSFADPKLLIFVAVSVCVTFALVWAISALFIRDRKKLGSFAQVGYRSNYVILGITLIRNVYGDSEAVAVASVVTAVAVPMFNMFAVILLSFCGGTGKRGFLSTVAGVAKNPLIIGAVLGLIVSALPFEIPVALRKGLDYIGGMASPIAFLVIGARIELRGIFSKLSLWVAAVRLVIVPLVGISVAVALGFRDAELMSLMVMFAAPAAVSSYAMATNMGCDEKLAADGVFVTTLFSVVTITMWLFVLRSLSLI